MDSIDRIEQIGICQLVQHSLGKLKILHLNSANQDCLDPTGVYSIGQLVDQLISYLEDDFHRILEQTTPDGNDSARTNLTDSNEDEFSYRQLLKNRMEIQALETDLSDLKSAFEDVNQELYEQEQLEIARNRFVDKWASARQEQLIYSITVRSESFRKDIDRQQSAVESGLRAARQTNDFYDWQLAKLETDIDDWKVRFECEKEQVDSRLQKARTEKRLWDELKEEMEEMNKEIAQLEQMEIDYIKEEEHNRLCHKYAVQLQVC
ncbi:uncharacterized protein LOC135714146 [Ochlerotatus camptorhynchus]|uniref:uncharacterized protein LOC135714146 n=1 Tax=Ochlerotatus camptorhynchus TaxID=644619 RepID=UPI0031DBB664